MNTNKSTKEIKDWTKPDEDGNISVPDELDELVNRIGFQFRFVTLSGKNEIQAVCDTAYIAQKFFTEKYQQETSSLKEENERLKKELDEFREGAIIGVKKEVELQSLLSEREAEIERLNLKIKEYAEIFTNIQTDQQNLNIQYESQLSDMAKALDITDDEIEQKALEIYPVNRNYDQITSTSHHCMGEDVNSSDRNAFIDGIKWLRDKALSNYNKSQEGGKCA